MQNSINPFNIRPANRVNNISEYYFSKKLKEIAELNARGLDIISLGIGGPDRPPHPETIETLCTESRKSDVHGYQPYIGLPELRRAFADWYNRWYNVTLDPQKEIQPLTSVWHFSMPETGYWFPIRDTPHTVPSADWPKPKFSPTTSTKITIGNPTSSN